MSSGKCAGTASTVGQFDGITAAVRNGHTGIASGDSCGNSGGGGGGINGEKKSAIGAAAIVAHDLRAKIKEKQKNIEGQKCFIS